MKLSIITINYNNKAGLERTIQSIKTQEMKPFEYIIIDGGSTDGSVDVIKEHETSVTRWISESDRGIYHAMNKGVQIATGEYILFINSGDALYNSSTITCLSGVLATQRSSYLILAGHTAQYRNDKLYSLHPAVPNPDLFYMLTYTMPHQSTVTSRALLLKYPFDEKMRISADRKFFFQALILHHTNLEQAEASTAVQYQYLDFYIAKYELGGISDVATNLRDKEWQDYISSVFPPKVLSEVIASAEMYGMSSLLSYLPPHGWISAAARLLMTLAKIPLRLIRFIKYQSIRYRADKRF